MIKLRLGWAESHHSSMHLSINLLAIQMVYQELFIMMFNLLYTAYPVILMAVLDQDVRADTSLSYPRLYYPGLKGLLFNRNQFAASAWQGLWSSFVLVSVTIGTFATTMVLHLLAR